MPDSLPITGARASLCAVQLLLVLTSAVLRGLPPGADSSAVAPAVVALWGRQGTAAAAVRCTGVFVAPEVVLSAASCALAQQPTTVLQHAACASGKIAEDTSTNASHLGCPLHALADLEVLSAEALPNRLVVGEVLALEFRYSVPALMPLVCTGGAVCGDGWDVIAFRVRQSCPRQHCIPPLPLSFLSMAVGEPVRLVGAGRDPSSVAGAGGGTDSSTVFENSGYALRFHDGPLATIRANQSYLLPSTAAAAEAAAAVATANAAAAAAAARAAAAFAASASLAAASGSTGSAAAVAAVASAAAAAAAAADAAATAAFAITTGVVVGCAGDAGAPLLRYYDSLEHTTEPGSDVRASGVSSGFDVTTSSPTDLNQVPANYGRELIAAHAVAEGLRAEAASREVLYGPTSQEEAMAAATRGGWAVVGILTHVQGGACAGSRTDGAAAASGAALGAASAASGSEVSSRVWSLRVARCWLWRVLALWDSLPSSVSPSAGAPVAPSAANASAWMRRGAPPAPPLPPVTPDTVQWRERPGVRALHLRTVAECAGSDHWPPELLSPSRPLPLAYAEALSRNLELDAVPAPTHAATCYPQPTHLCVHLISERGRLRYSVDDGSGSVFGTPLYLRRRITYTFQMVGVPAAHALVISDSETGPDRRRGLEVVGPHPAYAFDVFTFTATHATPSSLWYQSVSRSGVGGPIYISNTEQAEPTSLPEGFTGLPATPAAFLFWDANGARLMHWVPTEDGDAVADANATWRLSTISQLPLALLARSAVHEYAAARFRRELAEAMRNYPMEPNATNITDANGTRLVYLRNGVEINMTIGLPNVTAERIAYEALLPTHAQVGTQRVTAALLRAHTSEVFWSTQEGHLLMATLVGLVDPPPLDPKKTYSEYAAAAVAQSEAAAAQTAAAHRSLISAPADRVVNGRARRLPRSYVATNVRVLKFGNESQGETSLWKLGLDSSRDRQLLVFYDGTRVPQLLDLSAPAPAPGHQWQAQDDAIHFYNQSDPREAGTLGRRHLVDGRALPEDGADPADWFDEDSRLVVDWRRDLVFWCQRSRRRIFLGGLRARIPVLEFVRDALCTGLAIDPIHALLYWTSASGHLLFRASYADFNATVDSYRSDLPVYQLSHPRRIHPSTRGNTSAHVVVTAEGLAGDFGKVR